MLPPLPRCSAWAYSSLISPSHISLPRKGCRVGLHIDLFEDCSAFTRVAACTLARSPIRDPLSEGFRHFVTSMPAPVASGWSGCRVGLAPTGKRRLVTAHTQSRRSQERRISVRELSTKRHYTPPNKLEILGSTVVNALGTVGFASVLVNCAASRAYPCSQRRPG